MLLNVVVDCCCCGAIDIRDGLMLRNDCSDDVVGVVVGVMNCFMFMYMFQIMCQRVHVEGSTFNIMFAKLFTKVQTLFSNLL